MWLSLADIAAISGMALSESGRRETLKVKEEQSNVTHTKKKPHTDQKDGSTFKKKTQQHHVYKRNSSFFSCRERESASASASNDNHFIPKLKC